VAAHALKGSVGLFSKGDAYEAAQALEQAARSGDLSGVDERCAEVQKELSRVCAELETLLTKL
jgi:HPt (histidine-containing phosphotransfer) domain-containing protein